MGKPDRDSDDPLERIEWQLDQIRDNVNLLAWIVVVGLALAAVAVVIALLAA